MNLAIIPARGGSKRIPRKNTKEFAGKPLIAYSIEAALDSGLFDEVVVSTDDDQVASIGKQFGASVPFVRPAALSDDHVGTRPVTNHAIDYFQEQGAKVDYACCIYATAPFLQPEYLQKGLAALKQNDEKSFAFSVTSFPFPIQRSLSLKGGAVSPMFSSMIMQRSQDLEEAYHDAGQFYWGTGEGYLSGKTIFSEHSIPVILPRHLVQDIDTPEDWERAELMYKAYVGKSHG